MKKENLPLFHLVRKPKKEIDHPPLLIMLHGYGSNEQDLFAFAEELPAELFIISVRAPYEIPPYGYAWYSINWNGGEGKFSDDEQAINSREKVVELIEMATKAYPVNPENVTLVGFSQGCILSIAVALSYPEKVKNIIGLSGYANLDIVRKGFEQNDFSHLSFYISHGTADQVIPVDWARKTKPLLDSLEIKNSYNEFPVGHGVAPENFRELKQWLEQQI